MRRRRAGRPRTRAGRSPRIISRAAVEPVDDEPQRLQRHGVCPMQVLHHDQQRRQRKPPLEDGADGEWIWRLSCSGSTWLSAVSRAPRPRTWPRQRHQPRRVLGRHDQLRQQGGQLARTSPARSLRRMPPALRSTAASARRTVRRAAATPPVEPPAWRTADRPRCAPGTRRPGALLPMPASPIDPHQLGRRPPAPAPELPSASASSPSRPIGRRARRRPLPARAPGAAPRAARSAGAPSCARLAAQRELAQRTRSRRRGASAAR